MIGAYLQNLLQVGFDNLVETTSSAMQSAHVSDAIRSLVVDGIFTGVGTVENTRNFLEGKGANHAILWGASKIGRASCRERV